MEDKDYFVYEVTDEEIAEAKKEFPDLRLDKISANLDHGKEFQGIFKRPINSSVNRYLSTIQNKATKPGDQMSHHLQFCIENIVTPTKEQFNQIVKDLPALPLTISNMLAEGQGLATETKKKSL